MRIESIRIKNFKALQDVELTEMLREYLPLAFPGFQENVHWIPIPHEGKSDLEGAIPRKLRAWNVSGDRFIIVRDNDGGDCEALKKRRTELAGVRPVEDTLVRIVCQELEGWFLGDLDAVEAAYPRSRVNAGSWINQNPDSLTNPSDLLSKTTGVQGKITKAKAIAPHLNRGRNRSRSFQVFLEGIEAVRGRMS